MQKALIFLFIFLFSVSSFCGEAKFPKGPDSALTPGSLCDHPSRYRYAERIAYCERKVSDGLKDQIIEKYDRLLGFRVESMRRGDFKIDHFFPLCAGGSNNADNLWPQHKSVFTITDPLEQLVCEEMSRGRIKQAEAIKIIIRGKNNLSEVPKLINQLGGRSYSWIRIELY